MLLFLRRIQFWIGVALYWAFIRWFVSESQAPDDDDTKTSELLWRRLRKVPWVWKIDDVGDRDELRFRWGDLTLTAKMQVQGTREYTLHVGDRSYNSIPIGWLYYECYVRSDEGRQALVAARRKRSENKEEENKKILNRNREVRERYS